MSSSVFAPAPSKRGLGGPLAVIFWCACGLTALPLASAFSLFAALGPAAAIPVMTGSLTDNTPDAMTLRLFLYPQAVLFLWAAGMVLLTVLRSRLALTWGPWGLVAWTVVSAWAQFSIRNAISLAGVDVADFASLLPGLLMQALTAAAVFGYFREGTRPKAFYNQ